MITKNLKAGLFILFLCTGLSNQSFSQDGYWSFSPSVPYYNPHTNDYGTYQGIQKVQVGSDGKYYALVRIDYSYDTSNGPSARRKKDHAVVGIPYAVWNVPIPTFTNPNATIPVSSDDGIPVNYKTFGNNTTQYIWLEATSEDASNIYLNSPLKHVYSVAMRYSNDWLGLNWYLTAYHVMLESFYINDSYSKANVIN